MLKTLPHHYQLIPNGTYTPQLGYAAAPEAVLIQKPVKMHARHHPTLIRCQHCLQNVTSRPRSKVGVVTWVTCGMMILFGLWLGCCLIPFYCPDLQDTYHECPNCKNVIKVYKPMS